MRRSCSERTSIASPIEACGIVVGMYKYEPSSSGGMNSLPNPFHVVANVHFSLRRQRLVMQSPPTTSRAVRRVRT